MNSVEYYSKSIKVFQNSISEHLFKKKKREREIRAVYLEVMLFWEVYEKVPSYVRALCFPGKMLSKSIPTPLQKCNTLVLFFPGLMSVFSTCLFGINTSDPTLFPLLESPHLAPRGRVHFYRGPFVIVLQSDLIHPGVGEHFLSPPWHCHPVESLQG